MRLARTGIDPKLVGERGIDAIRNETFYAFVSAVPADVIRARHRRIEAELETSWTTTCWSPMGFDRITVVLSWARLTRPKRRT